MTLRMSICYHPQTGSQMKALKRYLEQYLCSFCHDKPSTWGIYLQWAEFHYTLPYIPEQEYNPFKWFMENHILPFHPTYREPLTMKQ